MAVLDFVGNKPLIQLCKFPALRAPDKTSENVGSICNSSIIWTVSTHYSLRGNKCECFNPIDS